jgi:hypothetical protein
MYRVVDTRDHTHHAGTHTQVDVVGIFCGTIHAYHPKLSASGVKVVEIKLVFLITGALLDATT